MVSAYHHRDSQGSGVCVCDKTTRLHLANALWDTPDWHPIAKGFMHFQYPIQLKCPIHSKRRVLVTFFKIDAQYTNTPFTNTNS